MAIPLPNLDDRTYADLVQEARSLIPRYAPDWTDYNVTDPGITLMELFAWRIETLMYTLNRIPPATEIAFLEWLGAEKADIDALRHDLEHGRVDEVRLTNVRAATVTTLRQPVRLVTPADFEQFALSFPGVARAKCLPEDALGAETSLTRQGWVSLILVPQAPTADEHQEDDPPGTNPQKFETLRQQVRPRIEEQRLLTCRCFIVPPTYFCIEIHANVVCLPRADSKAVGAAIDKRLDAFFQPVSRGDIQSAGWPFGRSVYASEIYQVIEATPDVDYVETLHLFDKGQYDKNTPGNQDVSEVAQIDLLPQALVWLTRTAIKARTASP